MKAVRNILILSILSLFIIQPVQGQKLLKRISDKALKKTEQRFEKKVDEKIDKELDKTEEKLDTNFKKKTQTPSPNVLNAQNIMKGIGLSGTPIPIADSYQFDHLIQMHLENFNKKGEKVNESEFITHFDTDSKNMAYQALSGEIAQSGQGMFIIDIENGATIILTDENGDKKGIVYGMGNFLGTIGGSVEQEEINLAETPDTYLANPNVSKTGRTKTIAGFKCEEFVYKNENTESNIWITKNIRLNTKDFFSTLFKTSMYSHGIGWGYMMESTTNNKKSGEKSVMQVTKVDINSNVKFSMSDYQITNLGTVNK